METRRRLIPQKDMLITDRFKEPFDQNVYRDGVICKCGAILMFKNREPYEQVTVVCPKCGFTIAYG